MRFASLLILVLVLASCGPSARVTRLPEKQGFTAPSEDNPQLPSKDIAQQFAPTPFGQWQLIVYNVSQLSSHEFTLDHEFAGGVEVKVRGELGRIVYSKPQSLPDRSIMDTVFFDTSTQRAVGFCRNDENVCRPFVGSRFPLQYVKYYRVTPRDWVLKFANASPTELTPKAQVVRDHFTTKVVFENPRLKTTLFLDEYTKLPISVTEEGTNVKRSYAYDNIRINAVDAKEVFH